MTGCIMGNAPQSVRFSPKLVHVGILVQKLTVVKSIETLWFPCSSYHSASSLYSHGNTNPFEITVRRDCLVPRGIEAKMKEKKALVP